MKILAIDDEKSARRKLKRFLAAQGHAVVRAVDESEAFPLEPHEGPDLALIDLSIPRVAGTEANGHLKMESRCSDQVLRTCNPDRESPVSITRIVDKHFGMDASTNDDSVGPFSSAVFSLGKPLEIDLTARTGIIHARVS
jgi:DNA-binding NarL/FixJ family response regulator